MGPSHPITAIRVFNLAMAIIDAYIATYLGESFSEAMLKSKRHLDTGHGLDRLKDLASMYFKEPSSRIDTCRDLAHLALSVRVTNRLYRWMKFTLELVASLRAAGQSQLLLLPLVRSLR
jgi:hypothetical protein